MMLRRPLSAHSLISAAIASGVSSKPPSSFGSPAFGWALTKVSAILESSSICCLNSFAPSAQLSPILIGFACLREFQKASIIWPVSVRPLASVMVPDIMMGRVTPSSSKHSSIAKIAAFAFSESVIVSISRRSAPPLMSPFT